jgi:cation:H+ antiporter
MVMSVIAILVGLALLVWSADRFVDGAAAMARHFGVSNLIIGITVIGFGTSAPEIVVSIIAVLESVPDIAIGNALGSNIANIGLILGLTALLAPIPVSKGLIRSEYPLLLAATVVLIGCLYDFNLSRIDGFILMGLLVMIMAYLVHSHRQNGSEDEAASKDEDSELMSHAKATGWILLGLIVLVGSSRLLVWGATNIAHSFGVSELIIGLTIVALGTSLPELAASIASLKKSIPDMAIGNVIGSNLFNTLAVVGIPPMISGFDFDGAAVMRDMPIMVGLTLVLFAMSCGNNRNVIHIGRWKGAALFSAFIAYQLYLYYEVVSGDSWFTWLRT